MAATQINLHQINGFVTKDSGKHIEYATGMKRDTNEGKGRYDLISPLALRRLAQILERGAVKYDAHNWEKGSPYSRLMESTLRHLNQYLEGMRDEDHLAAAMFGCMVMIHQEVQIERGNLPSSLMDLCDYTEKKTYDASVIPSLESPKILGSSHEPSPWQRPRTGL